MQTYYYVQHILQLNQKYLHSLAASVDLKLFYTIFNQPGIIIVGIHILFAGHTAGLVFRTAAFYCGTGLSIGDQEIIRQGILNPSKTF